jgi:hypothetical protein
MGCSSCGQKYRNTQGVYRRAAISRRYRIVNGRRVLVESIPADNPEENKPAEEQPKPEEIKPENG